MNLSNPVNATIDVRVKAELQITNDDAQGGFIAFNQSVSIRLVKAEASPLSPLIALNDLSGAATVDYFTRDYTDSATLAPCNTVSDFASSRCDYTSAWQRLALCARRGSKTFS